MIRKLSQNFTLDSSTDPLDEHEARFRYLGSTGAGIAGAALLHNAVTGNDLDGKKTYYAVSGAEKPEKITSSDFSIDKKTRKYLEKKHPDALKKFDEAGNNAVRLFKSKEEAKAYAKGLKDSKYYRVDLPDWDEKIKISEGHPVTKNMSKEEFNNLFKDLVEDERVPERMRSQIADKYDELSKALVSEQPIEGKYIVGKGGSGEYFNDLWRYIKENPGRFSGGVAKLIGGAGLLSAAAYGAYNTYKRGTRNYMYPDYYYGQSGETATR